MARRGKDRKRIMLVMSVVAETASALAAMPTLAVAATAVPVDVETGVDQSDMLWAAPPTRKVAGFALPEQRALPGFEPVQNADEPGPASASPGSNAVAGRYAVWRSADKDTGCMLTLEDEGKGHSGGKAVLSTACRDRGLVIFDPEGWHFVGGRLVLIAGKGRKTRLDQQADGSWKKNSKDGKVLILKRI